MKNQEVILNVLKSIVAPYTFKNLVESGVKLLEFGDCLKIQARLGFFLGPYEANLKEEIISKLSPLLEDISIEVEFISKIVAHKAQNSLKPIPNVKNIIAVASGKGGVGKSTTAVNLALALKSQGARVGLLDADIYGPSQPLMLGAEDEKVLTDDKKFIPIIRHGLQTMSIGYMVSANSAMIWRGPMVSGALQQMVFDTAWNDLDYLILDLPPGTGDIQLTMVQKIPVTGAVIVTTPQDMALIDVKRALEMFKKVNVEILGVIENMSFHICKSCNHHSSIFGTSGALKLSKEYNVNILGKLPLDIDIRENADSGNPTVISNPESEISKLYKEIALNVSGKIANLPRDLTVSLPKIVVKESS